MATRQPRRLVARVRASFIVPTLIALLLDLPGLTCGPTVGINRTPSRTLAASRHRLGRTVHTAPLDTVLIIAPATDRARAFLRQPSGVQRWLRSIRIPKIQAVLETEGAMKWVFAALRSEERRVGKECRSRWSPDH